MKMMLYSTSLRMALRQTEFRPRLGRVLSESAALQNPQRSELLRWFRQTRDKEAEIHLARLNDLELVSCRSSRSAGMALAFAFAGNAARKREDFWRSQAWFGRALGFATAAPAPPEDVAEILCLFMSLQLELGFCRQATVTSGYLHALGSFPEIAFRAASLHGSALRLDGRPCDALRAYSSARQLAPDEVARSGIDLQMALAHAEAGHPNRARLSLASAGEIPSRDRITAVTAVWIRGLIAAHLGDSAAEELLTCAQVGFGLCDSCQGFALATLDLAALYAQRGHARKVRRLSRRALQMLLTLGVERQALGALEILKRARRGEGLQLLELRRTVAQDVAADRARPIN